MRNERARLLVRSTRKNCPKTASITYDSSEQTPQETVEVEIHISDRAVFEIVLLYLKPWGPAFVQLEGLRLLHEEFFRLLDYRY